jgi:AAA15 family ATPase/GTPase
VEVYIQNWRCVEELKLSLGRINVFMGPNASGKSSVAYAVYLAARMPQPSGVCDPTVWLRL